MQYNHNYSRYSQNGYIDIFMQPTLILLKIIIVDNISKIKISLYFQLDGKRPRALNLRSFHCCWDSRLDFCAALEFECHPSVSVDSYRVNDCQPELFVKLGEGV